MHDSRRKRIVLCIPPLLCKITGNFFPLSFKRKYTPPSECLGLQFTVKYFYPASLNIVEKTNWLLYLQWNMKVLDKTKRQRNHTKHSFIMILRHMAFTCREKLYS